ncbi:OmpA family protein [Prevotella communis]|uniref:OmpA family protein n=1 Tax=Prevotella communis TaxID=2913614 RepID=UPI001ED9D039|nr:OmpA family protein [Prevotella communis]UKK63054.1 OmpA family protein [Prevotella communis]UKK65879.1 OmpA family protein [Prevotella communis]UKK68309.1 OmpA family protein [Prevotella communis]UKK69556.1 OmpA family protein [Prevotella communis]
MMKKTTSILMLLTMLATGVQTAFAQSDSRDYKRGWYAGLSGGTSFGQATFRSITESKTNVGAQFGVFGGYQFSRLLSVEALATMGGQKQTSLDCDPFWLATDGEFTFAPVLGKQGNYYRDLEAKTRWMRFGLQANFDVLSLLTKPTTRWSVTLSPQLSAVTTRTKHLATGYEQEFDRQWHLGLGGQAAVGYRVVRNVGLQLYGGITCLTGDRFDNIPKYCHKSNLIYEAGLKVAFHFGKKKPAPVVEEPAPIVAEPAPQPVVEEHPAVEQPIVEQPVVETAAVEEKKPEVVETAPADLPAIYFANNSSRLTQQEADKLDTVSEMMKAQPDVTLSIIGHASNIGSNAYNDRLSKRRANAVKALLVRRGIDASRLKPVVGRGIDRDAADSKQARRVELIINDKK